MANENSPQSHDEPIHPWILDAAKGDEDLLRLMLEKEKLGDTLNGLSGNDETINKMREISEQIVKRQEQLEIDSMSFPPKPPEVNEDGTKS